MGLSEYPSRTKEGTGTWGICVMYSFRLKVGDIKCIQTKLKYHFRVRSGPFVIESERVTRRVKWRIKNI